jgi:hypothetical protein
MGMKLNFLKTIITKRGLLRQTMRHTTSETIISTMGLKQSKHLVTRQNIALLAEAAIP